MYNHAYIWANWISFPFRTEKEPLLEGWIIALLRRRSPRLSDNAGSLLRNSSVSQTLPDKRHATNVKWRVNGCSLLEEGRERMLEMEGKIIGKSSSILSNFGYQCCVFQRGTITMASALSLDNLCSILLIKQKGGNGTTKLTPIETEGIRCHSFGVWQPRHKGCHAPVEAWCK